MMFFRICLLCGWKLNLPHLYDFLLDLLTCLWTPTYAFSTYLQYDCRTNWPSVDSSFLFRFTFKGSNVHTGTTDHSTLCLSVSASYTASSLFVSSLVRPKFDFTDGSVGWWSLYSAGLLDFPLILPNNTTLTIIWILSFPIMAGQQEEAPSELKLKCSFLPKVNVAPQLQSNQIKSKFIAVTSYSFKKNIRLIWASWQLNELMRKWNSRCGRGRRMSESPDVL